MNRGLAVAGTLVLGGAFASAPSAKEWDRPALVALMDQYLEALAKHDPSRVPLASNVKLVENTEVTPIGKGLWETATGGPTDFRIYVADPVARQVGFIGVIEEKGTPTILGARLKVVDGRITEIDHLVIHSRDRPLSPHMAQPRPALLQPLAPSERVPRDQMLKIANSYYEAIVQDDGTVAPFADECQRRENGGTSANDQEQTPEEAAEDDFSVFRKMKCGEQLSTGVMSYITDINRRRLLAVDEEMGLVFGFSIFVHDGEPKVMKIIGVPGITERANTWGPFDLPAAHIFKIRGGQIYEIEAIGYVAQHGIQSGWEADKDTKLDLDESPPSIAQSSERASENGEVDAEQPARATPKRSKAWLVLGGVAALAGAGGVIAATRPEANRAPAPLRQGGPMYNRLIVNMRPLGFMWETEDPFLFCVHHADAYPAGNDRMGPAAPLRGRSLGQDLTLKDGWRMYHGIEVPGFPAHPHRGFETVTVVLHGFVDHSDSHGAAGRYGAGDVQWMTAGAGLQHCEMFRLIRPDQENPLELFQIWLNLPKAKKFADPHYAMLWAETIPTHVERDAAGRASEITVVAGAIGDAIAPPPAPDSWAAARQHDVGIWIVKMQANAQWVLPSAASGTRRSLYFYDGTSIRLAGIEINVAQSISLLADQQVIVENGPTASSLLLLQGMPIDEPVAQYGPFVMNTRAEINQAIDDFRNTQFGGWPWPSPENVHPRASERFARYADGREERVGT
jgi:redox-sensitive bicupin YhaK (pirin superfamily)